MLAPFRSATDDFMQCLHGSGICYDSAEMFELSGVSSRSKRPSFPYPKPTSPMSRFSFYGWLLSSALLATTNLWAESLSGWKSESGPTALKLREQVTGGQPTLTLMSRDQVPGALRLDLPTTWAAGTKLQGEFLIAGRGQRVRLSLETGTNAQMLADLSMKADWQPLDVALPAPTPNTPARLLLQSIGEGPVLLRSLRTSDNSAAPAAAKASSPTSSARAPKPVAALPKPLPGMRAGIYAWHFGNHLTATDGGWTTWQGEGTVTPDYDTQMFKDGAKSLRLSSTAYAYGMASAISSNPPAVFRVTGFARAKGTIGEALIAIQFFDANWQKVSWYTILEITPNDTWEPLDATIDTPTGAMHAALTVSIKGQGTVWLDEPFVISDP
jgi:hypothetical protein